jgi:hypothetical protein
LQKASAYFYDLLELGVTKLLVIRRSIGWQAEIFTGPGTKVPAFAALTAKGSKGVAGGINTITFAMGASDVSGFDLKQVGHGRL